jgi:hypothetical protein
MTMVFDYLALGGEPQNPLRAAPFPQPQAHAPIMVEKPSTFGFQLSTFDFHNALIPAPAKAALLLAVAMLAAAWAL